MTGPELTYLLTAAAEAAEESAPTTDPVTALARERRRREQRRGHVVALAFAVFVLVLQLAPSEALGADHAVPPTAVAAAAAHRG